MGNTNEAAATGVVIQPDQGEKLMFRAPPVPDLITNIVIPAIGATRFAMGTQELPVGYLIPLHKHEMEDEILFFHKGTGELTVGGVTYPFVPGTTAYIPHGTWHTIHNTGDLPGQMLWFVAGPGLEGFFREASVPPGVPWSPLPIQVINEIGEKYGLIFAS